MRKTLAVVVTYRNPTRLEKCLASLKTQSAPLEIFVHDNSESNLLYTAGVNAGMREALRVNADYVLLVADDVTMLNPNVVTELEKCMEKNPKTGMASTVHIGKAGNVTFAGGAQAFPYGHHYCCEPSALPAEPYDTHWANTSCVLIRTEAIRECGFFDPNMRFVCSDSDYSFHLRTRGWGVQVVPTALVEHDANMAAVSKFDELDYVKQQDFLYFTKKWLTGGLYRDLSIEGKTLKREEIEGRVNEIITVIAKHELHMRKATPGYVESQDEVLG